MADSESDSNHALSTVETVTPDATQPSSWEWKPYSLSWWQIVEASSSILGIVGNLLVMLVLYRRRAANRMTDTLIRSLSLADFLTSIFMFPLPLAKTVPSTTLGLLYCKMTKPGLCLFVCFTASIYTLVAMSVERFIAVVYPLQMGRLQMRRNVVSIVLAVIWTSSIIFYVVFVATVVEVDPAKHACFYNFSPTGKIVIGAVLLVYRLIFPVCVMVVTNIAIACTLHRQSRILRGKTTVPFHIKARNQVLKLMLIIIIIYIICWGPGQIIFFLFSVGVLPPTFLGSTLHNVVIVLMAGNSCLNPIVYAAWFSDFRVAVRRMFSRKPHEPQDSHSIFGAKPQDTSSGTTGSSFYI